jgi:pimeloyl-ACP methyl ester carboxylesterase
LNEVEIDLNTKEAKLSHRGNFTEDIVNANNVYAECHSKTSSSFSYQVIPFELPILAILEVPCPKAIVKVLDPADIVSSSATSIAAEDFIADVTREASGIAADGTSLGLVAVEIENTGSQFDPQNTLPIKLEVVGEDPATLKSYGTLHPFTKNFPTTPPTGSGSQTLQLDSFVEVEGRYFAVALLQAPDSLARHESYLREQGVLSHAEEKSVLTLKASDRLGNELGEANITLYAPPVLMIHGLWSSQKAWQKFAEALTTMYRYPAAAIDIIDYSDYQGKGPDKKAYSYRYQPIQDEVASKIDQAIKKARDLGIIATQVDVVAHSMGGLVTRYYAGRPGYKNSSNYREGAINRLITVATPHLGSPLADWLIRNRKQQIVQNTDESKCRPAKWIFGPRGFLICLLISDADSDSLENMAERLGMDITGGAAEYLQTMDRYRRGLLARPEVLPYQAIIGEFEGTFDSEKIAIWSLINLFSDPAPSFEELFAGDDNDVIVASSSAGYGSTGKKVSFNLTHTELPGSGKVHDQVFWWLSEADEGSIPDDLARQAAREAEAATDELDMSTMQEVSASTVTLSLSPEAPGDVIGLGDPYTLSISSTKTISRVLFAKNFDIVEDIQAEPFSVEFQSSTLEPVTMSILVIFDDNTFAFTSRQLTVGRGSETVFLQREAGKVFLSHPGPTLSLAIEAVLASGATLDVSSLAEYATESGTANIISVSDEGLVTANGIGQDRIIVTYDGKSTAVDALVSEGSDPATFNDVLSAYWAWPHIEALSAAGVTGGCGNGQYCPENSVTRAQMAVFLLRAHNESSFSPPAATGDVFADVAPSHWAAAWVEQFRRDGITSGCGNGRYCPEANVTRAEMAVFLLKAKYGSSYRPPAATGNQFSDIPSSFWASSWIEQLASEGITGGCGGGKYCPNNTVTRAQMAVFIARTFDLPLPSR